MNTSASIVAIVPALVAAQAAIKPALKDSENPHFKSKYADLASVWDACREALTANDIVVVQDATTLDGQAAIVTCLLHKSGEWLQFGPLVVPAKQDAHGVGSAISYGRRYALSAALGIVAEDDDGNAAVEQPKPKATRAAPKPARDPIMDARVAFFQSYQTAQRVGIVAGRETSTDDGKRALLSDLCGFKVENVEALRLDQWQAAKLSLDEKIADARAAAQ